MSFCGFKFIREESLPLIAAAQAGETPHGWDRAAADLRKDYERWSRLGLGVIAWFGSTIGIMILGVPAMAFATGDIGSGIIGAVLGLMFAAPALYVLFKLWSSGGKLSRAAAIWLKAPYEMGLRRPAASGWLEARVVNYEPPMLARIFTAAFAFLAATMGIVAGIVGPEGERLVATFFGVVGLVSAACMCGQIGGLMNIVNGLAVRDPVWMRIRSALTRRK